jgi:formiminotetrahydrofolate cyclodeaminase
MLVDRPLREVLDAVASATPTPGGGSAAAVASALGASLLAMVAGLPKTRSGSADDRSALDRAAVALTRIRGQLAAAIDLDADAYDQVVAASRRSSATETDPAAREARRQLALRTATEVPLGVMRLSVEAATEGRTVAARGHRAAASDVGVALALLQAGLEGARLNVRVNVPDLTDRPYVEAVNAETARLVDQMEALVLEATASIG